MNITLQVLRRRLGAVAVMVLLCAPSLPQGQAKPEAAQEHVPGKKLTLAGVKNFGQVTPFLYRGAQPSREGFQSLASMGVDIVVDARLSGKDNERKAVTALGMQYVSIPWHCLFPKDQKIAQFLKLLRDNPGKRVFVHCRYGDDRTGMMIAAYRMAVENWTAEEARREMDQFGFNHTACFPVGSYEKAFPGHLNKNAGLHSSVAGEH